MGLSTVTEWLAVSAHMTWSVCGEASGAVCTVASAWPSKEGAATDGTAKIAAEAAIMIANTAGDTRCRALHMATHPLHA